VRSTDFAAKRLTLPLAEEVETYFRRFDQELLGVHDFLFCSGLLVLLLLLLFFFFFLSVLMFVLLLWMLLILAMLLTVLS